MSATRCRRCGCGAASPSHAIALALLDDDIDAAMDTGLLDAEPCADCSPECTRALGAARDERRFALAARERYRARTRRLERRAAQREAARASGAVLKSTSMPAARPELPASAAEALKRALERAKRGAS